MEIMSLEMSNHNIISNKQDKWFIYNFNKKIWVFPARCPHRRNPLYLGKMSQDKSSIICSLHKREISFSFLKKHALPLIHVNNQISIIVPNGSYSRFEKTLISDNENA